MYLLLIFFLLISNHYCTVNGQNDDCCEEYCYSDDYDKPQTHHYSTKTAYKYVREKEPKLSRASNVPSDCQPTKIWILSRHGTRLPDKKFIKSMSELNGIRNMISRNFINKSNINHGGILCTPDLINIKVWKVNSSITEKNENELTTDGFQEIKDLATHYQSLFPNVLTHRYDKEKFKFYSTNTNRTRESLKAFAVGLFGQEILNSKEFRNILLNDSFLRPHESCSLFIDQNEADKNNPNSEIRKFQVSELFHRTASHISKRLGFKQVLPDEKIELIWDMCRYEQAWHVNRSSTWCAAFTKSQNQVFEYQQDLKYYHKTGYGHELNTRMACYVVQDMLKHLNSNEQPQVITYFSHSALIQLFLVALGVFKDNESLRADNFDQMQNRKWQTSSISPFLSNILAIKYDCPQSSSNVPKVLFLLNEKPLNIDGCNLGFCDLSYIMNKYEHFSAANCQEYYCSNTGFNLKNSIILTVSSFIIYILYLITNNKSFLN